MKTGTELVAESSLSNANSVSVALNGSDDSTPSSGHNTSIPIVDLPLPWVPQTTRMGKWPSTCCTRCLSGAAKNQPSTGSTTSGVFIFRRFGKTTAAAAVSAAGSFGGL